MSTMELEGEIFNVVIIGAGNVLSVALISLSVYFMGCIFCLGG